jgi:dienelactone hydrolase
MLKQERTVNGLWRIALMLCFVTFGATASEEDETWKTKPAISIEYLSNRSYESSLHILQKLGDFDGYSSYAVEYDSDGLALRALMNVPSSQMPEKGFPTLIMNHGHAGNNWVALKENYSTDQDSEEYRKRVSRLPITRYAREGFVVLYPDYRGHGNSENFGLNEGYWQVDRHGKKVLSGAGKPIPRVLDDDGLRFNGWLYSAYYTIDVLNLIAALSDFEGFPNKQGIDMTNIFMWGRSLGGDVSARAITCTDKVNAVSLWVPATTSLWDQAHHYHYDSPDYADGISMENLFVELKTYNKVNNTQLVTHDLIPNNFIRQVKGPVMIQVSIDDRGVRSAWGIQYHYELQEYGIETELEIYAGDDHVFKGDVLEQAIQADLKFFRSHMQP